MGHRKCQICKTDEAMYVAQVIGGLISFYCLGWHIRGWKILYRVCYQKACVDEVKRRLTVAETGQTDDAAKPVATWICSSCFSHQYIQKCTVCGKLQPAEAGW